MSWNVVEDRFESQCTMEKAFSSISIERPNADVTLVTSLMTKNDARTRLEWIL